MRSAQPTHTKDRNAGLRRLAQGDIRAASALHARRVSATPSANRRRITRQTSMRAQRPTELFPPMMQLIRQASAWRVSAGSVSTTTTAYATRTADTNTP